MRARSIDALRPFTALAAIAAAGLLAAGCGGGGKHSAAAHPLQVEEGDFQVQAPSKLQAGTYTFQVHNHGPTFHELIIAPTTTGSLPLRKDGLTVDEEAFERDEPGALEPAASGAVRDLTVTLKPGRYVLFCNMEGHYMAGMHAELDVL
jgi:uncharacterized cupredoxin-like copper-binding protein